MEKNKVDKEYESLRSQCIQKYRKLYKDSLVFDLCKVDKPTRVRLLEDPVYLADTKAIKASLFESQIDTLDSVLGGVYSPEPNKDISQIILKAMEMKQKLLLDDIGINDDVKNALNIVFTTMSKEDFENLGTVEINEGNGNTDFSSDYGMTEGELSAEEKARKMLVEKQLEEKRRKESEDGDS